MKNKDKTFKVGDQVFGDNTHCDGGDFWMYIYDILDVENSTRFGKPTQLLTVKVTTTTGLVVDQKTKRWPSQLI